MAIHLATPISQLTRVGAVTAKRLAKLGIAKVRELLEHWPLRYEDYTKILDSRHLESGLAGSMVGTITAIAKRETSHKHMKLSEAELDDGYGIIKLIWFNQPFITETLKEGDRIIAAGTIERDFNGWVIKNPAYEKATLGQTLHTARLVPIYPATYGLTQKQLRFLVSQALAAVAEFWEIIPEAIKKQAKLIDKIEAIRAIHLPENQAGWQRALRYLKFEELFLTQILTEQSRRALQSATAPAIPFQEQATKELVSSLPFKLTTDQRKAAWQILKDLSQARPMNRLLQGEVGSGKTVVAAIAALNASESGFQTALMAPTEILALKHYQTISQLFPDKPVALLTSKHSRLSTRVILNGAKRSEESQRLSTGSQPEAGRPLAAFASVPLSRDSAQDDGLQTLSRNDIKKAISEGKVDIIIGTHAIIQNDVIFKKLGLIVIDEQHRFGVEQRKQLKDKSVVRLVPHLLSMTATPIPRSLALSVYGDLDISTIRELPVGRVPIDSKIIESSGRAQAYRFMADKIKLGQQAFVVCPLIEDSDVLGVKSATAEFEKLQKIFPNIKIGLLHGKLKSKEKEAVMADFRTNQTAILAATAVVEVGVDVPNASIMVIEGAERFGLAQLHQFRGRVGRGEQASFCFLFPTTSSAQVKHRLQAFINTRDGFEIAELDLKLRGPGQIYGTTQSGFVENLKIASLSDSELISETKNFAKMIMDQDPLLARFRELKKELQNINRELHLE